MDHKALIIIVFLALIISLEFTRPFRKKRSKIKAYGQRILKNGFFTVLNAVLSPFIILPMSYFAANHALWVRPDDWPFYLTLVIDILILDIWIYFMHRAMHKIDMLWRFHQVHHLDQTMDTTNALRFHFGEVVISGTVRMAIIAIFAIPFTHILIFETLIFCAALFQHANIRLPNTVQNALGRIIVTPKHHWVHHHTKHNDLNHHFATLFVWWDRIFKTQSPTTPTPDMPIGIPTIQADPSIIKLMVLPFLTQKD